MNKGSVYIVALLILCLAGSAAAFVIMQTELGGMKDEIAALKNTKPPADASLIERVAALENAEKNPPQSNPDRAAIIRLESEINNLKRMLAARPEKPADPVEAAAGGKTADADPALNNPAVENIKKEVKEELRAEEKQRKQEQRLRQAEQGRKYMQQAWETKMKDEFPKLAEKIKLSVTVEDKIKEIADGAFNKIMAMLDEQYKLPEGEEKWDEFMKQTQEVYKEAETQIRAMVNDEQAKELDEFFKKQGW